MEVEFLSAIMAVSLVGLIKQVIVAALAVLNAVLAILASIAIWKSYLVTAVKIFFTLVILIPIVGVVVYLVWGQKKVRSARDY